jgi:hypothetical protein
VANLVRSGDRGNPVEGRRECLATARQGPLAVIPAIEMKFHIVLTWNPHAQVD